MKDQNEVKCKTCGDTKQVATKSGNNIFSYTACPDCTAPQPTDEEIREAFKETSGYISNRPINNEIEYRKFLNGWNACKKAQSAKLKEQAYEIERLKNDLQKNHNSKLRLKNLVNESKSNSEGLMIIIDKEREEKETLSSLLSEAVEKIKEGVSVMEGLPYFLEIDSAEYELANSSVDLLKKLEQFTKE